MPFSWNLGTLRALRRDFRGAIYIYLYYLTIEPVIGSPKSVEMWKSLRRTAPHRREKSKTVAETVGPCERKDIGSKIESQAFSGYGGNTRDSACREGTSAEGVDPAV